MCGRVVDNLSKEFGTLGGENRTGGIGGVGLTARKRGSYDYRPMKRGEESPDCRASSSREKKKDWED